MYTAVVLSPMSVSLLKWVVRATVDLENKGFLFRTGRGDPLPHHMTLNLGHFDTALNDQVIMGGLVQLEVRALHYNEKIGVCAAPVTWAKALRESDEGRDLDWVDVKSANPCPHVTVCLLPQCKPKESNRMLEEPDPLTVIVPLTDWVRLEGTVEICG